MNFLLLVAASHFNHPFAIIIDLKLTWQCFFLAADLEADDNLWADGLCPSLAHVSILPAQDILQP